MVNTVYVSRRNLLSSTAISWSGHLTVWEPAFHVRDESGLHFVTGDPRDPSVNRLMHVQTRVVSEPESKPTLSVIGVEVWDHYNADKSLSYVLSIPVTGTFISYTKWNIQHFAA